MRVYWSDIRSWLTTTLFAVPIVAVGGFFGWTLTHNAVLACCIGLGWYAFTRLYMYIDVRARADPNESEARALWKHLRRTLLRYRDGTVLITGDRNAVITVHRARTRGFSRTVAQDVEYPGDDTVNGILPVEFFVLPGGEGGFVLRDGVPLTVDDDGMVGPAKDALRPPHLSRRERKKRLKLELEAGTMEVSLEELRELNNQLRQATVRR